MASKSKSKGKTGERELCVIMAETFGGSWIRVPSSGAFVGGINVSRMSHLSEGQILAFRSDVIPPDEYKHCVIEVKFYKEFPFHRLFQGEIPLLNGWLTQVQQGIRPEDVWFISFKINGKGWFICMSEELITSIKDIQYSKHFTYTTNNKNYIIADLKPFLLKNCEILKKSFNEGIVATI